jgi:hypothetical protein
VSSYREQDCDDAGGRADGEARETDLGRACAVAPAGLGVFHLQGLAELAEVVDAPRPEAGAEPETSLEIPRRGGGRWKGDEQPDGRRCADRHEPGQQDDRGTEPDVPCAASPGDLGRSDVADARLVSLAGGGCPRRGDDGLGRERHGVLLG